MSAPNSPSTIQFSIANHPDQWYATDYGGVIKFASAVDAKAAEKLFNDLSVQSDRDAKVEAYEIILNQIAEIVGVETPYGALPDSVRALKKAAPQTRVNSGEQTATGLGQQPGGKPAGAAPNAAPQRQNVSRELADSAAAAPECVVGALSRESVMEAKRHLAYPELAVSKRISIMFATEIVRLSAAPSPVPVQHAELVRLREIEHLAWHLMDDSEEDAQTGEFTIHPFRDDALKLSALLPEDHPEAADALSGQAQVPAEKTP